MFWIHIRYFTFQNSLCCHCKLLSYNPTILPLFTIKYWTRSTINNQLTFSLKEWEGVTYTIPGHRNIEIYPSKTHKCHESIT